MLTPATIGILAASAGAGRFARRHPQRWLIIAGFLTTAIGMILLLVLVRADAGIWRWIPGLLLFGAGVGTMLTSSVNVVQSSFPGVTVLGRLQALPAARIVLPSRRLAWPGWSVTLAALASCVVVTVGRSARLSAGGRGRFLES